MRIEECVEKKLKTLIRRGLVCMQQIIFLSSNKKNLQLVMSDVSIRSDESGFRSEG